MAKKNSRERADHKPICETQRESLGHAYGEEGAKVGEKNGLRPDFRVVVALHGCLYAVYLYCAKAITSAVLYNGLFYVDVGAHSLCVPMCKL